MPTCPPGAVRKAKPTAPSLRLEIRVGPVDTGPGTDRPTAGRARGWALSLVVHGALVLSLACWYVAPRRSQAPVIETRLVGTELGVDEATSLTGGLNTEIQLVPAPDPAPGPAAPGVLDAGALKLDVPPPGGAALPSAGGGVDNPNPGAGRGDGSGLGRHGEGGESVNGVFVRSGDPQFTLLWDSEADLDLHVIEPGGAEIYCEDPKGRSGGELDVDNAKGFGPENVYWLRDVEGAAGPVKGPGPPGVYRWFVVYSGALGGMATPTHWKVRVQHAGKDSVVTGTLSALGERSREHTLLVNPGAPGTGKPAPGDRVTAADAVGTHPLGPLRRLSAHSE
jgi:hypothetical protein